MSVIYKEIHIGQSIKDKVEEKGWTKKAFAENLGIARQNIDKTIFSRASLDSSLILRISKVLNFNFFALYFEEVKEVRKAGRDFYEYHDKVNRVKVSNGGTQSHCAKEIRDLRDQIEQLKSQLADKEKIIQLLEG